MTRRRKTRTHNPLKPPYQSSRDRKRAEYRKDRPAVREARWEYDGHRCVFPTCRTFVTLAAAHIHEVIFRSAGGDPLSIENTATTCSQCHNDLHVKVGGKLKRIEQADDGTRRYFARTSGTAEWTEVKDSR